MYVVSTVSLLLYDELYGIIGYILILDNGKKIVFRAQNDYHEIFLREKFFMTILIGSMIKYVRKFML